MKQLIKDVLNDMSTGQISLSSNGARELIATTITAALKTKGSYKEYTDYELDEQKARASWVCSICGENTFEVDSDYIGSGTNHLGCEMKTWNEIKDHIDEKDPRDDGDYYMGPDGHYERYGDIPHELSNDDSDKNVKLRDEVFEIQKQLFEDAGDGTLLKVKDDEVYHVVKHLGYDTKDKKQTIVGKISKSQLNNLYPWHEEEQ